MKGLEPMELRELKNRLNGLATAHEESVLRIERDALGQIVPVEMKEVKAIVSNKKDAKGNPTSEVVVSKQYSLIQHQDAFSAVVDALVAIKGDSVQVKASVMEYKGRAWLTCVFPEIKVNDGADGIELGFTATNSFDKTSALSYGAKQKSHHNNENAGAELDYGHFEFFGYRLACMNGMKIRVPLSAEIMLTEDVVKENAKVGDLVDVRLEKVDEKGVVPEKMVLEETATKTYVRHYGKNVTLNLQKVKDMFMEIQHYIPILEARIKASQEMPMSVQEATELLNKNAFGPRAIEEILKQFAHEEQTRWGLYNSITNIATHGEKKSPMATERMLRQAEVVMVRV